MTGEEALRTAETYVRTETSQQDNAQYYNSGVIEVTGQISFGLREQIFWIRCRNQASSLTIHSVIAVSTNKVHWDPWDRLYSNVYNRHRHCLVREADGH